MNSFLPCWLHLPAPTPPPRYVISMTCALQAPFALLTTFALSSVSIPQLSTKSSQHPLVTLLPPLPPLALPPIASLTRFLCLVLRLLLLHSFTYPTPTSKLPLPCLSFAPLTSSPSLPLASSSTFSFNAFHSPSSRGSPPALLHYFVSSVASLSHSFTSSGFPS